MVPTAFSVGVAVPKSGLDYVGPEFGVIILTVRVGAAALPVVGISAAEFNRVVGWGVLEQGNHRLR